MESPSALRQPACIEVETDTFNAAVDVWGNLKLCAQIYDVRPPKEAPYRVGNILETPFMELWTGERMNSLRRAVADGSYEGLPRCAGCDHRLQPDFEQAARRRHEALLQPRLSGAATSRPG